MSRDFCASDHVGPAGTVGISMCSMPPPQGWLLSLEQLIVTFLSLGNTNLIVFSRVYRGSGGYFSQ